MNIPTYTFNPRNVDETSINTPQDSIDHGTIRFNNDFVHQGGKRAILGECVVTGHRFEAVFLHENPDVEQVSTDEPMRNYEFDRIQPLNNTV